MSNEKHDSASGLMPDRYDRLTGQFNLISKPVTIEETGLLGVREGGSQAYIYRVGRNEDGDWIFLKIELDGRLIKIVIPARVTAAIDRTRQTLAARVRSNAAKRGFETRLAAGTIPDAFKPKGDKRTARRHNGRRAPRA